MRMVCDMCGGTGQKAIYATGQTDSLNFDICPMCGGQGYLDDMVYQLPQTEYSRGFKEGFAAGLNEGMKLLVEKEMLEVKPIYLCRKCGKELGFIKDGEDK